MRSGLLAAETQLSSNNSWPPPDMFLSDAEAALQSIRKRVFSVRLGKFRNLNGVETGMDVRGLEGSSRNLDQRRCYSMGSYQYVVGDLDLQVTLSPGQNLSRLEPEFCSTRGQNQPCPSARAEEGKKINARCRGESFSVSKIWLWSNSKNINRVPNSSDIGISMSSHCNARTQDDSA